MWYKLALQVGSTMYGIHVKIQPDFNSKNYKTLENALAKTIQEYPTFKAIQIFTHGPKHKYRNNYNATDIKNLVDKHKIKLFIHAPYIPTDGIWNALSTGDSSKQTKYINILQELINATDEIGALGLVIHITKQPPEIIAKVMKQIQSNITNPSNIKIILEMKAMKPDPNLSYETAAKSNRLCEVLSDLSMQWGLCIDTSHLWACGIDISNKKIISSWFDEFKYPKKLLLFHLNGASYSTFGKGKDTHIIPFSKDDDIWNKLTKKKEDYDNITNAEWQNIKKSSFGIIMHYAKINKIPFVCEMNRGKEFEMDYFIDILDGLFY